MPELKEILAGIPKSELHVHLRGAMPVEVFANLRAKYPVSEILQTIPARHRALFERYENIRRFLFSEHPYPPDDDVSRLFRYSDFDQFLATWCFTGYFVRQVADLRMLIAGVIRELGVQNVVYAEITISLAEYTSQGISLADIKTCLEEVEAFPGIRVRWIVDLVRDTGKDAALALLNDVIGLGCKTIVGITLGGSEHLFPPRQFSEVYDLARDRGLHLTVHAGEALGPHSVWDALRILRAERIGHGVRSVEDESLVAYMAENNVPLEVCPTSNIRTGIYPSYEAHPVRALFEAGVPITINSDDPAFFGTNLTDEYAHVHSLGIPNEGILSMIKNGFKYAFLPRGEIEEYLTSVEQNWSKLRSKV